MCEKKVAKETEMVQGQSTYHAGDGFESVKAGVGSINRLARVDDVKEDRLDALDDLLVFLQDGILLRV